MWIKNYESLELLPIRKEGKKLSDWTLPDEKWQKLLFNTIFYKMTVYKFLLD